MRAVVFDVDGTLIDSMRVLPKAYVDTIVDRGGPELDIGEVVANWSIGTTEDVLGHFLRRDVGQGDIDCFLGHVESGSRRIQPFPHVELMLRRLAASGRTLGVFTGADRRTYARTLGAGHLSDYFGVVVCGDEVSHPKPSGAGLRLACRGLGTPEGDTVYVGDSGIDMECARDAGVRGIQARWGTALPPVTGEQETVDAPLELLDRLDEAHDPEEHRC